MRYEKLLTLEKGIKRQLAEIGIGLELSLYPNAEIVWEWREIKLELIGGGAFMDLGEALKVITETVENYCAIKKTKRALLLDPAKYMPEYYAGKPIVQFDLFLVNCQNQTVDFCFGVVK